MSLIKYLNKYYKIQQDILLVSHPTETSSWGDRCYYLDDDYDHRVHYNHRGILRNEIVIEYDEDSIDLNRTLADKAASILSIYNIKWSKWFSGNKSYHLHFFVDTREAKRIPVMKSIVMRFFGVHKINGNVYKPDLQLAANNHNIRAEYGIHEKTNEKKSFVSSSGGYPNVCELPTEIWELYVKQVKQILKANITNKTKSLEYHPIIQKILNTTEFRKNDDGRERALFVLIHILKPKYKNKKQELTRFLQDWYKYSGGHKLSPWAIECKVNYHWEKEYSLTGVFLNNLAYELGLE